jgi:RNA polymerase sigma-70 factor (ECF subfamily)
VCLDPGVFLAHLGRHLDHHLDNGAATAGQARAALQQIHGEELYLCAAAAQGDEAAIATLEESYFAPTAAVVDRLRVDGLATDDVLQQLRASMLVGTETREPEILRYSGRGALLGWLRVVATRAALRTKRQKRPHLTEPDASVLDDVAANVEDPELSQIRARYAPDLEEALACAFRELLPEQRVLLRMYVVDGATLAELGNVHGVDASTISRWLRSIRDQIGKRARTRLQQKLSLRRSECDSLVDVLQSQLHVSIARLLESSDDAGSDGGRD